MASLTNRARLETRAYDAVTIRATAPRTCFLCRAVIPVGASFLKTTYRAREYRSACDIGSTTATARVCAACVFPKEVR